MMETMNQQTEIGTLTDDPGQLNKESITDGLNITKPLSEDDELSKEEEILPSNEIKTKDESQKEKVDDTCKNAEVDIIKPNETDEEWQQHSLASTRDAEEIYNENEEADRKTSNDNSNENEKLKLHERDSIDDEMERMHSFQDEAESAKISIEAGLLESKFNEREEQKMKKQIPIEIEDSSDSSSTEVNYSISNKTIEGVENNEITQTNYKSEEEKENDVLSISDEESMHSLCEDVETNKIDNLTAITNAAEDKETEVIDLENESSQDEVKVIEDSIRQDEHSKEKECLTIAEESQQSQFANDGDGRSEDDKLKEQYNETESATTIEEKSFEQKKVSEYISDEESQQSQSADIGFHAEVKTSAGNQEKYENQERKAATNYEEKPFKSNKAPVYISVEESQKPPSADMEFHYEGITSKGKQQKEQNHKREGATTFEEKPLGESKASGYISDGESEKSLSSDVEIHDDVNISEGKKQKNQSHERQGETSFEEKPLEENKASGYISDEESQKSLSSDIEFFSEVNTSEKKQQKNKIHERESSTTFAGNKGSGHTSDEESQNSESEDIEFHAELNASEDCERQKDQINERDDTTTVVVKTFQENKVSGYISDEESQKSLSSGIEFHDEVNTSEGKQQKDQTHEREVATTFEENPFERNKESGHTSDEESQNSVSEDVELHSEVNALEDCARKKDQNREIECAIGEKPLEEKILNEYISDDNNVHMRDLNEKNNENSLHKTEIDDNELSCALLNGSENSNENNNDHMDIDEEYSRHIQSENIANECNNEKDETGYNDDLKPTLTDENSLVNCIKRQFLKIDYNTESPKLNGDHKESETNEATSTVINIQENSQSCESAKDSETELKGDKCSSSEDENDKTDFESNLKIVEDQAQFPTKICSETSLHFKAVALEKSILEPMQIDQIEDDNSRTSIASSNATSSSHHLVIDDTETVATKKTKKKRNAKISRKRKLSQNSEYSETAPRQKQLLLDMELKPTENEFANVNFDQATIKHQVRDDSKKEAEAIQNPSENILESVVLHTPNEVSFHSPLSRDSPLLNSLLTKKNYEAIEKETAAVRETKMNNAKYLCFNCKTGSYDSLTSLNEHQRQCLANKVLFPSPITRTEKSPPHSPENKNNTPIENVSVNQESEATVEKLRFYKCSSCGTFHENWNLFLHIREIHKRHMCLYCIRMFPTAEKLSLHLEIKHDLEQNHFNSEEALRKSLDHRQTENAHEIRYLMCCTCQHVFQQSEPFSDHVCTEYMQACDLCGQKGRHTNQCKAQTEAKRSRVKKKAKEATNGKREGSDLMTPQPILFPNPPETLFPTCDKTSVEVALPANTLSQSKFNSPPLVLPQQQNEDSNSSCNMVIDETCNRTNYSGNMIFNPFKALDEQERLEQQKAFAPPEQPIDRLSGELEQSIEKLAPVLPLIVPKFKLRVPKEFQKSVDAAISSSESDEEDEVNEEDIDNSNEVLPAVNTAIKEEQSYVSNESAVGSAAGFSNSQEYAEENSGQNMTIEDEDSLDEPNSNLARILQEIERTKLDIMRTKDALQTAKTPTNDSSQRSANISQSSSRAAGERNWTPTPPASPKPHWSSPRRAQLQSEKLDKVGEPHEFKEELVPSRTLMPVENQERRDTTGSEVDMDIDETISGQPTMCIQRSAPNPITEENEGANSENKNEQIDTSTESGLTNDTFSRSKEYLEENSNSFASEKQDMIQENTEDISKENDHIAEDAKPNDPQAVSKYDGSEYDNMDVDVCDKEEKLPEKPSDGIEVADEDTIPVDLQLDRPLEKFEIIEFVRICLKAVYPLCLYCNHARRIAVNGKSLVLHLIAHHRFAATVDSITAEELKPETIVSKLKTFLPALEEHFFNSTSYCTMGDGAYTRHFNERIFECFQCRFVTSTHKELYLHNRKMHIKTAILCFMCRANFFSFSEILCHICPGEPYKTSVFDVKFRCCLCDVDNIPSPFRLMVHLRKKHFACDVCLEDCRDQGRLSSHVWKHKLHHLCYRCGIAYRNKMDITKHLFWKHGTESIICKRCLQKRWRHVYHFCIPPINFICDICTLCFSKATYLKVHKRIHVGDLRYPCTEENCDQKFISRRLLLKHTVEHQLPEILETKVEEESKKEETTEQKSESQKVDDPKIEDAKIEEPDAKQVKEEIKEEAPKQDTQATAFVDSKTTVTEAAKPRKKKKSKRNKESLEDLNLIAPNLSESDSSDDSDMENKSKSGDDALVAKVMLSPPSDIDQDKEMKDKSETGKVLEIWKNFLQSQGSAVDEHRNETDYTEDYYPTPKLLHVVQSDHDYCKMVKPVNNKSGGSLSAMPAKSRKGTAKSPRRTSARKSDASSSSSGSSSSSDSSCSCGSNCSCSSSNSDSSSSSSSSDDSSTAGSNASRKRHRKKSQRMRKKSESASPSKKHSTLAASNSKLDPANGNEDLNVGTDGPAPTAPSPPNEPLFYESDLESAESETDEEFYDEHPQKLASELLAQKRAQLMAQTRLSPSHNFDIVENSRPSTPSLPDEVAREKKVKLKKKKRDRKSTSRSVMQTSGLPALKLQIAENVGLATQQPSTLPIANAQTSQPPHTFNEMLSNYESMQHSPQICEVAVAQEQPHNPSTPNQLYTPRPIGFPHHTSRMSEGSSCSDADASLKRSKRARRPNKFYGYTSDDENAMSGLGQPLMIGMRAIKPQPPPQLTWRKEDLPTPSKSVINNKNKTPRTPKVPGGPFVTDLSATPVTSKNKRVRNNAATPGADNKPPRKRLTKKPVNAAKLPPIPTLKIRPSQIGFIPANTIAPATGGGTNHIPASQIYSSSKESDDDEEEDSTDSSSDDEETQKLLLNTPVASTSNASLWSTAFQRVPVASNAIPPTISTTTQPSVVFQASLVLPPVLPAPPPPPPQARAFNQKIPPALLPNPDFATLQYFKANNIRYPIRPPAGARQAREGESVYCYCRCPYDEVSEMIACDGDNCLIEWFHFECVGIMVAPQGKWFCAECRPKYSEELYPTGKA